MLTHVTQGFPDTSVSSFFLELFLHWSPVAYWAPIIFQCPIFLPFHTVHGVLKARILKWVAMLFSSAPCFVRTLYQWRNNSRKNKGVEPKQKQHPVVDVTGDGGKVWCCKVQYCIGTWKVRSMIGNWKWPFGSGQTGDGKSEHWHFRNQWTKMDWNGWI